MDNNRTYLDTYVLQQDMRIRLPKSIITNLSAQKGVSKFDIYLDTKTKDLILKLRTNMEERI